MIAALLLVLFTSFVFVSNVYLAHFLRCNYWRVQILLKSALPSLSPMICKLCYCCTLIYAMLPFATVIACSLRYSANGLEVPSAETICIGLFLLRDYITFYQFVYASSIQWNLDKKYKIIRILNQTVFFAFQVMTCCFVLDFSLGVYNAVFLGFNSFFCFARETDEEPEGKLDFHTLCGELMNFLENHMKSSEINQDLELLKPDVVRTHAGPMDFKEAANAEAEEDSSHNSFKGDMDIPPLDLGLVNATAVTPPHSPRGYRERGNGESLFSYSLSCKQLAIAFSTKNDLAKVLAVTAQKNIKPKPKIKTAIYIASLIIYPLLHL
eukprot:TRINITY_DN7706_c0_g1_i13.p1 TRINITY_DN7706_c0_g1~~TRINITY_DN7706_c0_g1_i13.p1  ORF type:complete len:324 (+),score=22.87 TRINITY_DN7706_c0_g1_i13:208-1179(+)